MARPSLNGVRAAVPLDAESIAGVQLRAWQAGAGAGVPAKVLDALDVQDVHFAWATAIASPPSPRHRVLVAVAAGTVVGFAATTPAGDPDSEPEHEGEIAVLQVDPSHRVAGHGSRLLSACIDGLRDEGCDVAYHWISAADLASRSFFVGAGWAADGAQRELGLHGDGSTTVGQLRLHTSLLLHRDPGSPPDTDPSV